MKAGSLADSSQDRHGYLGHFVTIAAYFGSGVATSVAFWFALFLWTFIDSSLLMPSLLIGLSLLGVLLLAYFHHKRVGRYWMRHATAAFIVGGFLGTLAVFMLFLAYAFILSVYYE